MSDCQDYPYWRVMIGFTLCPALVSVFMFLVDAVDSVFIRRDSLLSWEQIYYLPLMLVVSLGALLFYGVPALILALIYANVRLYKSFVSYFFVSFSGGGGAHLWGWGINYLNSGEAHDFPYLPGLGTYGPFFLAATCSLIMAYFVLPAKETLKKTSCS